MVQIIAHRGARSLAPENTLAAADLAFELGADLWEADVQQTRDGHLVLFHDQTLERCTNVNAVFPERKTLGLHRFDLAEILTLDAGSFFENSDPFNQIAQGKVNQSKLGRYRRELIPTLSQGLLFTKKKQWVVNLELKLYPGQSCCTGLPEKTLQAIEISGLDKTRVVISSFHHPWLDWIQQRGSGIRVQALVGEDDAGPVDFGDFRFAVYNVNADCVSPRQIAELKKRGKEINLFTVNDPKSFEAFRRMGVNGIFTDFPQLFVRQ